MKVGLLCVHPASGDTRTLKGGRLRKHVIENTGECIRFFQENNMPVAVISKVYSAGKNYAFPTWGVKRKRFGRSLEYAY